MAMLLFNYTCIFLLPIGAHRLLLHHQYLCIQKEVPIHIKARLVFFPTKGWSLKTNHTSRFLLVVSYQVINLPLLSPSSEKKEANTDVTLTDVLFLKSEKNIKRELQQEKHKRLTKENYIYIYIYFAVLYTKRHSLKCHLSQFSSSIPLL